MFDLFMMVLITLLFLLLVIIKKIIINCYHPPHHLTHHSLVGFIILLREPSSRHSLLFHSITTWQPRRFTCKPMNRKWAPRVLYSTRYITPVQPCKSPMYNSWPMSWPMCLPHSLPSYPCQPDVRISWPIKRNAYLTPYRNWRVI